MTSNESLRGRLLDGRYLIEERVARGGMASVYTATDTRLDRLVAIKIMHRGLGDDDEFAARFVHEARAAAKLNHPNVVAVFDQGDDDGTVFLAMEYVPGQTLRDLIREHAPLPPRRALALLEQILMALAAAHEAKIVHRDVKPENVLIAPDGRVKVADFGLARAVSNHTSATTAGSGVLIGTVSYLAPELVVNKGADARSDIYSCGVVLYELLTGTKPHEGETPIQIAYAHVHEDVPPPSHAVDGVPPYLDALVARATARDRDLRPTDARVMLHQVRRVRTALDEGLADDAELTEDLTPFTGWGETGRAETVTGLLPAPADHEDESTIVVGHRRPASTPPVLPPPRKTKRRRRRGPLLLAAVLVLALLAGAAGWYAGVGRFTTTPPLAGMTQTEAEDTLVRAGLDMSVSDETYSETIPAGSVVATDPGEGEKVTRDGTVSVVMSLGKERYGIPDLRGMDEQMAREALANNNLGVGEVTRRYSEKSGAGTVISIGLEPGKSVKPGTAVDLLVSRGPRPIEIIDYTGKDLGPARRGLEADGFTVKVTDRSYDDDVPAGSVISQSPDSGTGFKTDRIALVVSRGPHLVDVPNVVASGVDDAQAELKDAGFAVDVLQADEYIGFGLVVRQSPGGGEQTPFGSTVTIYIV